PTLLAVAETAPGGAGILFIVTSIIGSLVGTLGPFISWLIVGDVFLGSLVFGGDGEFRDLSAAIGWGLAPRMIVPLVGGITAFVVVSGTNFSDPQQARQLAQMTTTGTVGIINNVVNAGTFIWVGWVWTHAVARVRNISTQNAAIVVEAVVMIQTLRPCVHMTTRLTSFFSVLMNNFLWDTKPNRFSRWNHSLFSLI
ncbi:MAG: Yip1 domain protein, partial [Haloquadratum walsbyi J07HQW1]